MSRLISLIVYLIYLLMTLCGADEAALAPLAAWLQEPVTEITEPKKTDEPTAKEILDAIMDDVEHQVSIELPMDEF